MPKESQESFGSKEPMGRPGQLVQVATCFVFLESSDSRYMSGQVLHPNGGRVVGQGVREEGILFFVSAAEKSDAMMSS